MATAEQLNQAIALIQGNQYADAEALLTPLLNQSATDADVWQLIALARKGQLDLAGAEVAFKQSIDLHPAPAVVTNLGNLYRQMDREQDALACYNRAIEAAPSHLPARVNKGRSLLVYPGLKRPPPFTPTSSRSCPSTPMPALVLHSHCNGAARLVRPRYISRKLWPMSPKTRPRSMGLA